MLFIEKKKGGNALESKRNEARLQYYKAYREKYRDKINKQQREYYFNNKERFKKYAEDYWERKNKMLEEKENCRC